MKLKKGILVIISVLVILCLGLTWFILRSISEEEIIQSSSFIDMFGLENMGQPYNAVAQGIVENMHFDIVGISGEVNDRAIATISVTVPDIVRIYIETVDSFQSLEGVSDNIFYDRLASNMQNHSMTIRRDFEVMQKSGEWRILNRREIDNLIEEQLDKLMLELLRRVDFTPVDVISAPSP